MGELSKAIEPLDKYQALKQRTLRPFKNRLHNFSLKKMREMRKLLGYPDKEYKSIHVAGTNGKGSVCFKLSCALQDMGFKVGLFSSPHIRTLRERISINQKVISREKAGEISNQIHNLAEKNQHSLIFFEEFTLLAMAYFAQEKVDYVVWETGVGGLWDATNILQPIVSVITSIGWDHMRILGNTLEKIAAHKAGIIKRNTPVVVGPTANILPVKLNAKKRQAPYYFVDKIFPFYEEENQQIAKKTLSILFPEKPEASFDNVLKDTPPLRFEKKEFKGKTLIMDVAHNLTGFERLKEALLNHYPEKKWSFILAFSKTEHLNPILNLLQPLGKIYLTSSSHFKLISLNKLKVLVAKEWEVTFVANLQEALKESLQNPEGIVITGSFFLFENLKEILSSLDPEKAWS